MLITVPGERLFFFLSDRNQTIEVMSFKPLDLKPAQCSERISRTLALVCRGLGGRFFHVDLAAFHRATVWDPVEDVLSRLQRLEVLPGTQQRRIID